MEQTMPIGPRSLHELAVLTMQNVVQQYEQLPPGVDTAGVAFDGPILGHVPVSVESGVERSPFKDFSVLTGIEAPPPAGAQRYTPKKAPLLPGPIAPVRIDRLWHNRQIAGVHVGTQADN